ncbi:MULTISPECIES: DUF3043 domain-containing protein [Microbacterium]|uniref:DUF3043 domain-containing protein n=1 Tax=Microbacterium TaxID=33882 RepID=UPI0006F47B87|nr:MULTISPECIES: DUF3043 domain-containing protein [unclassified Microbacterium]MBN9199257.1 DUF3043 domain-containing protein [Microbacterium ginsengisoli]MCK9915060.1 DUF3043 domain-containing protein [Microbacteriaceae bacterium K1510]KQR90515.1 hypothetical protein ASF93_09105 [Microbacterium sp. Leaf347]KQR91363.1 hypothetical protein ASG00_05335 [Microbacterium sp. Leaf351]OJU74250.1 MAG: hypothetical protein BGO15_12415 [Microbacterium sp. 71-23]
MAKTPAAPAPKDAPADSDDTVSGKGRPTPSRAEQEAARKRPLVPDTKEAKARARAELSVQREKARVGMAAGEERYLPVRDKGPQRRFVRDYVDAGWHLGELILPAMVLVLLAMVVNNSTVQFFSYIALWAFVALAVIDMVVLSARIKRAARRKFGADRIEKGLGWYGAMRSIQMRFMRLPKAQVKRGQYPS